MKGKYSLIITGPTGAVMSAVIDLEKRDVPVSLAVDDERLEEALIITSMCAGCAEGELIKRKERE